MLLLTVKGATSYEDSGTWNSTVLPTFKATCSARGLLGDDREWFSAFDEAVPWATSPQLRQLFVTVLLYCEVNDEYAFFEKVWKLLTDDIQYQFKNITNNSRYELSESRLKDYLLDDLEILFARNGSRMRDYNLPQKTVPSQQLHGNRLIQEELAYDLTGLLCESEEHISSLNSDQMHAFKAITQAVSDGKSGFFSYLDMVVLGKLIYGMP